MAVNMENKVLSIEQMNHLKELGVDTSGASVANVYAIVRPSGDVEPGDGHMELVVGEKSCDMRFTLQDILNLTPKHLKIKVEEYRSPVDCLLMIDVANDCIYYEYTAWGERGCGNTFGGANLLTSAYEMLCWLSENDYLNKK